MADRRRRPHSEGESDEESTETSSSQSPRKPRPSECESEGETKEGEIEVSDYESANEENGEEEEEEEESEEETEEEEDEDEEEYEDEDVIVEDEVGEERQSGDGEEQPENQKLDDDEDRKNPAFIPRQGAFYEHDLRLGEDGVEDDKRPRKKLWQDEGRWSHDKYADYMQGPKSREELITLYGYDIRLSDKPPDAPPRRGGGPRRPRLEDKPQLSDFVQGTSRDDSYLVERKNEYNRNRDRYFRGKSEELQKKEEDREAPHSFNREEHDEEKQPEKFDQWNSRYEENQSYRTRNQDSSNRRYSRRGESNRGYSRGRDTNRNYDKNQESNRSYNRNHDSDQNYERNQDSNRSYEKSSWREYENRAPRYENRNYREYRNDSAGNYDQRGGRYSNRGYRNDPPRREFRNQRLYAGSGRSRHERGRGGAPRRSFDTERKIPPRFQKKKEARLNNMYNTEHYVDNEQMQNYYEDPVVEEGNYEGVDEQLQPIQTEVFTPSTLGEDIQSQHPEAIDEKNAKAENVIVQSSTGERKSYLKERRARTVGKTRVQDSVLNAVQEGMSHMHIDSEAQTNTKMTDIVEKGEQRGKRQPQGQPEKYKASSKQDSGRSKRYSSQRQRNPEQLPPENPPFFPPEIPKGYSNKEIRNPQFQQPILRAPIPYPIPVSTAIPNAPPQRLFRPPPVSMAGGVPIIPPQFINTGVIFGGPAPAPYPVAPLQGFPSPPPVSVAPPPPIPAVTSPNQLQEVYRHGTTYYPPELQYPQIKKRSPPKRTKSAIPIVNPQEQVVSGKVYVEEVQVDREPVPQGETVDDRDVKLQETIDREFGFEEQNVNQPVDKPVMSKGDLSPIATDETFTKKPENVDSEMDSLSTNVKRLTTDRSNYTIAFSTEQDINDKGDYHEDITPAKDSPVLEDKNSGSPVVPTCDQKDESTQDNAANSSSQEVTVS